jgi:DNA polymerase III alpha subunit (gram-positive type)
MIALATKNRDIIVPSYDFHFLDEKQKIAQDAKLSKDGLALFRQFNSHHLRSRDELLHLFVEMGYEGSEINAWFDNLSSWATKFDNFKLKTSDQRWVLPVIEGDSLSWAMSIIKAKGRMKWDDPVWVERLEREIRTLKYNGKIDVIP